MGIAENIKRLRLEYGLSQSEFGKIAGVSDKAVSTWENGTKTPRMGAIQRIADHFGVPKSHIIEDELEATATAKLPAAFERYTPKGRIPLLGRVAAGLPLFAEENIEGYIASDFDDSEIYYALRVCGDSMNAAGIDNGDIVVVRQQSAVEEHEIAVVLVNGDDATIKYFKQEGDMVVLTPKSHNPTHQTQIYNLSRTPVRIIGRVIQVRKSV